MSDKRRMPALSPSRMFVKLSVAGIKRAKSVFRSVGATPEHPDWQARAELCSRCPLCVTECGGRVFCGKPLLRKLDRDEPTEGCGCPVIEKAKDPAEHCPRDAHFNASSRDRHGTCDCVWCVSLRG